MPDPLHAEALAWAHEMFRAGDLRWRLQDHQLPVYDAFRAWNVDRQTDAHVALNRSVGGLYHNVWVDESGRRVGKTAEKIVFAVEEMIRRPGCRGMLFTPHQKKIGGIIVPLVKLLFRDVAPEGYYPEYRGTRGPDHEGLYIEATDSWCKLVGVDLHPEALRGEYLDFCAGTEAAFVKQLSSLVRETLQPQFQQRPWGWMCLESSTAKQPDHEFNAVFREDAQLRQRAHPDKSWFYVRRTIEDNTALTAEEIEIELDKAGGRNHPGVRREYFCEEVRDPEGTVIPEFDAPSSARPHTAHVVPAGSPTPSYAHCYVAMDPGFRDPLGAVWGYVDFERNKLVIQADFAEINCSLERAGKALREIESRLWWTEHREPGRKDVPMLSIHDVVRTAGGLVWEAPKPALTYWAANEFQPNPYRRVSDVAPQWLSDLVTQHGLNFEATAKDDAEAALNALRLGFSQNRIEIWDCCTHLIKQLRSGTWNDLRTDWDRTPTLGHLDCVSALIYLWRNIQWRLNPHPPHRIDTALHDIAIPVGIDKDTATGRRHDRYDTRFRESSTGERRWR